MSFFTPTTSLILAAAYFLGSIPFGLILAKLLAGSDIRKSGSGNIGATNVARVAGPAAGIFTLTLDVAKGAAAVWLAGRFTEQSSTAMTLAGVTALLGHCFPIWLKFKGGKGVAPALGVFLMLAPLAALGALFVFIVVSVAWRYVSLGSISAAAAMPLLMYFLWAPGHAPPLVVDFGTLFASALVIFKHDANLQRLVDGTEPKFSFGGSKGDAT
ncbi:MAG TPA: glycerol-3-phosphate 1-O-acyltransferase PlsY [Candidatus Sulfotelmatobacter sp.]|jgi:glycerol-3-phosphate acyltransferase PlsY|nr:glycerol-3-phosphate 1-O-acyltransferase PlsY [Candidatus Sulfotelmatobacter sp.]